MKFKKLLSVFLATVFILNITSISIFAATTTHNGKTVTTEQSAEELVRSVLGEGIQLVEGSAKVTYSNSSQVGIFSGAQSLVGIDNGLALSTGDTTKMFEITNKFANSSFGGSATDNQLKSLSPSYSLHDFAIVEFKLKASGSKLKFDYVFASSEFSQPVQYNDIFGLFVNGQNIAKLPNGNPVTIQSVKTGGYFTGTINNFSKSGFDGISNIFSCEKDVTPGSEVTIKFAIADASDDGYDSAVFIKANSLNFAMPESPDFYGENVYGDSNILSGKSGNVTTNKDGTLYVIPWADYAPGITAETLNEKTLFTSDTIKDEPIILDTTSMPLGQYALCYIDSELGLVSAAKKITINGQFNFTLDMGTEQDVSVQISGTSITKPWATKRRI